MLIKNVTLSLVLLFCYSSVVGQWQDDFSTNTIDGNEWVGDLSDFVINANQALQLMAPDGGNSVISHPVTFFDENVWIFKLKMDFAPSGSNKTRVYLMADYVDNVVNEGVYLEMGETGSTDAIHLYKNEGGADELLLSGSMGAIAAQPVEVMIKVERKATDVWRLSVDYGLSGLYTFEGEVVDAYYPKSIADGLLIDLTYTSTRTDKFYFDDFDVKEYVPDVVGPQLINTEVVNDNTLKLTFDEPIMSAGLVPNQFSITGGQNPTNLTILSPTLLQVSFNPGFVPNTNLTISLTDIPDIEGNISALLTGNFEYTPTIVAQEYDILINELMADPSPALALPECEYIELYNHSDEAFDLGGYTVESGGTPQVLPTFIFEPDTYVVIVDSDCEGTFSSEIDVLQIPSFPSLSNSGDFVTLRNDQGDLINTASYSIGDYGDPAKDDGGWSLELINPEKPCIIEGNWIASNSLQGGTPGRINSVWDDTPDIEGPNLVSIFPISPTELEVTFSEQLDPVSVPNVGDYTITDGIEVLAANLLVPQNQKVALLLNNPLDSGTVYTLTLQGQIADCLGNTLDEQSLDFGLSALPEPRDILINEILFDPYTGGAEFVEFYNNSAKIIDLNDLLFVADDHVVSLPSYNLLPQHYVALSTSPLNLQQNYTTEDPSALLQADLPSFVNKEGKIRLYGIDNPTLAIDSFYYNDNMHLTFIVDTKGVSLERSSFEGDTNDKNLWHSAAEDSGFATPGYLNSQYIGVNENQADLFTLREDSFSPNQDGYRDFLTIDYALSNTDNIVSLDIYNAEGYLVDAMAENVSLAQKGFLTWDGLDDDNLHLPAGIYILVVNGTSLSNNETYRIKLPFVLALPFK